MFSYILKRLLLIIPTLLGILTVNFLIIQAAPGGPVEKAIAQIKGNDVSLTQKFSSSGGEQGQVSQNKVQSNFSQSKYRGSQGIDPDLIKELGAEAHLNTCFKHFMFFILEFKLVADKEMKPIKSICDRYIEQFNS